eukprot:jgi/Tetstr1/426015/TSEL_016362.t1
MCSGGSSTAPISCACLGSESDQGNKVQRRPVGADLLRTLAVKAAGRRMQWRRRQAACTSRGSDRGAGSGDGPLASTRCMRMPRRRLGYMAEVRHDGVDPRARRSGWGSMTGEARGGSFAGRPLNVRITSE